MHFSSYSIRHVRTNLILTNRDLYWFIVVHAFIIPIQKSQETTTPYQYFSIFDPHLPIPFFFNTCHNFNHANE